MEEVPENTTVNQKALRWVTILCPCAMVGVWLVGVGIWALWLDVLDHSTMVVKPCGEIMLNCLYFGFGLCSALYLPGDKKMVVTVWVRGLRCRLAAPGFSR